MGSIVDKLLFIVRGGKTKRFHTADTLTHQTVAEHSFGVAWLCHLLLPNARKDLILAALAHDLAEHVVGDVSSVFKKAHPEVRASLQVLEDKLLKEHGMGFEAGLTDDERRVLKVADLMDGMLFCLRERSMGSKIAIEIYNNFKNYVCEYVRTQEESYLVDQIDNMWKELNV